VLVDHCHGARAWTVERLDGPGVAAPAELVEPVVHHGARVASGLGNGRLLGLHDREEPGDDQQRDDDRQAPTSCWRLPNDGPARSRRFPHRYTDAWIKNPVTVGSGERRAAEQAADAPDFGERLVGGTQGGDAEILEIGEGTSEVRRMVLARELGLK
jgi:hypothetical protein